MTSQPASDEKVVLIDALPYLRLLLERHVATLEGRDFDGDALERARQRMLASEAAQDEDSPLHHVTEMFDLSTFERHLLLLCAGLELDGKLAQVCPQLLVDGQLTFSLALAALPEPHWSALSPDGPLWRWHLVEVGKGSSLTLSPIRIDERILNFLVGLDHLDARLASRVEPVETAMELTPTQESYAGRMANVWNAADESRLPVLQLSGASVAERRSIAAVACEQAGLNLYVLQAFALPESAAELDLVLRLWEREAILSGCALVLECEDRANENASEIAEERMTQQFIERAEVPLFVSTAGRRPPLQRTMLTFDLELRLSERLTEQRLQWKVVLGGDAGLLEDEIERLVYQFDLTPSAIRSAHDDCVGRIRAQAGVPTPVEVGQALWQACRANARPRLDAVVQRIESTASWDDLIGTEQQTEMLRAMALQVKQRAKVYGAWRFSTNGERGLGIAALFAGPSGTGKTLAAEVLAGELQLDLYRVDLSAVVSKYIGETEKNLRRAFDAAEAGGAILLFDEADALFGKRSEVKDSHDRHANIEVSYLLQRMEAYRGLSILTTNLKDNLDPAFLRRLRFIVHFPFPDASLRTRLWERAFPPQTPVSGLDFAKLSRLNVAGGDIRNIALNAAFLAAHEGSPVTMQHLHRAARSEYSKLQRPLTDAEVRGWEVSS
jgi:AAA+ superfamily predicted ATPase